MPGCKEDPPSPPLPRRQVPSSGTYVHKTVGAGGTLGDLKAVLERKIKEMQGEGWQPLQGECTLLRGGGPKFRCQ